jgi:predicted small secreted protein
MWSRLLSCACCHVTGTRDRLSTEEAAHLDSVDSVHPSISLNGRLVMYTSLVRVCNAVSGVGIDLKTTASIW